MERTSRSPWRSPSALADESLQSEPRNTGDRGGGGAWWPGIRIKECGLNKSHGFVNFTGLCNFQNPNLSTRKQRTTVLLFASTIYRSKRRRRKMASTIDISRLMNGKNRRHRLGLRTERIPRGGCFVFSVTVEVERRRAPAAGPQKPRRDGLFWARRGGREGVMGPEEAEQLHCTAPHRGLAFCQVLGPRAYAA